MNQNQMRKRIRMASGESSLDNLTSLLVEACSSNEKLTQVTRDRIVEIVESLRKHTFSEDDRKSSVASMNKIIDRIVDDIYQGEKA